MLSGIFTFFEQGTAFVQTNIPLAYQLATGGGGSWLAHQPYIQMQHQLQPVRTRFSYFTVCFIVWLSELSLFEIIHL